MVDIKINAKTPGFTKPKITLKRIRYSRKNLTNLTFENPVLISGVDGVISID